MLNIRGVDLFWPAPVRVLRTLSLGTRTPVGLRVVPLLASVIDTCCQRGHAPWCYLERAIADRHAGLLLAPYFSRGTERLY